MRTITRRINFSNWWPAAGEVLALGICIAVTAVVAALSVIIAALWAMVRGIVPALNDTRTWRASGKLRHLPRDGGRRDVPPAMPLADEEPGCQAADDDEDERDADANAGFRASAEPAAAAAASVVDRISALAGGNALCGC